MLNYTEAMKKEILELKSRNLEILEKFEKLSKEMSSVESEKRAVFSEPEKVREEEIIAEKESLPQQKMKCKYCKYVGKNFSLLQKHLTKKHKAFTPSPYQLPIACIRRVDGCPNSVKNYSDHRTALCEACQQHIDNQILAFPSPSNLCMCC